MPTYEYACKDCGEHLEVVQAFTDDALTECPRCGGRLRKLFNAVGVVFKGSGFYRTDSRAASSSSESGSASSGSGGSAGSTSTKTESKPDSKPAASSTSSSSSAD